jgi:hypothetical protein
MYSIGILMEEQLLLLNHLGRDISRFLTREILREIDITPEKFIEILKNI